MSVSCQSWEGGSGPGVGYKIGAKVCQACSDGSNFRHQPESVACGLTSFRIYMPNPDIPKPQCVGQQKDGKPVPTQFGGASQNGVSISSSYDVLDSAPSNFKVNGFASGSFRCDPIKSSPNIPLVAKDIRSLTNATSAVVGMEQDRFSGDHSSSDRCQVPGPELISNGGLRCGAREESSSSSASSIDEDSNDMEVQSTFHGPLDQMDSLMSSLPIKRGLSKFYIGKSKSFTSLADVKSVKDLPKPDNPYARKRKLLHGQREGFERQRFPPPRTSTVGITKRAVPSSISGLTVALAMCKRGERLDGEDWDINPSRTNSMKGCGRGSIPSRSFSLTDLQKA